MEIVALHRSPIALAALAEMTVEAVAGGASVTFLHPLSIEEASTFWDHALGEADAGRRIVLGAVEEGVIVGTVTLLLDTPQNQRHRAEIVKMMTREAWRGRGIARALIAEAERVASADGRTLLTLDTAAHRGAAGFYEKNGYVKAGTIPGYALAPDGVLSDTLLYYKKILQLRDL